MCENFAMKNFVLIALVFVTAISGSAQIKTDSTTSKTDSLTRQEVLPSFAEKPQSELKENTASSIDYYPDKQVFRIRKLYAPTALLAVGLALNSNNEESLKNEIVEERNENMPHFRIHVDDFLQFSPIAIAYGLDALGIKSKTDLANRSAILLKSELGMLAVTLLLKKATHIPRPDGSGNSSFPSGHTAQAFVGATFLSEEYKDRYPWMPYVAYGLASGVGVLRMANNKHYISDVLVGAALGILSTKIAYWTHHYKWGKKNR